MIGQANFEQTIYSKNDQVSVLGRVGKIIKKIGQKVRIFK